MPFTCIRFSHARSPRADRYSALFAGGSSIRYFTYRPTVFTLGYSVHPRAAACASNAAYSSVTVGLFCENLRSNQMFSMIACCSAVSVGNVSFSRGFRHSASARKYSRLCPSSRSSFSAQAFASSTVFMYRYSVGGLTPSPSAYRSA